MNRILASALTLGLFLGTSLFASKIDSTTAPKTPFGKLTTLVARTSGIEQVSVDQKILPATRKEQDLLIKALISGFEKNKDKWKQVKKGIRKNRLSVKKLIFSDQNAVSMDLSYSALFNGVNVDVYVKSPSEDITYLVEYLGAIKRILLATDLQTLDEVLSYRAPGDKICINVSPDTGVVADFIGIISLWNLDLEKMRASKLLEENSLITKNIKSYLMSKKLGEKPEAAERIRYRLSDYTLDDEGKISATADIIDQEGLYNAQFLELFSAPRDNSTILSRMLEVAYYDVDGLGETEYNDQDLAEILSYYDLKVALTCFIAKLTLDDISIVEIDMKNALEQPLSRDKGSMKLNMDHFFYR